MLPIAATGVYDPVADGIARTARGGYIRSEEETEGREPRARSDPRGSVDSLLGGRRPPISLYALKIGQNSPIR